MRTILAVTIPPPSGLWSLRFLSRFPHLNPIHLPKMMRLPSNLTLLGSRARERYLDSDLKRGRCSSPDLVDNLANLDIAACTLRGASLRVNTATDLSPASCPLITVIALFISLGVGNLSPSMTSAMLSARK